MTDSTMLVSIIVPNYNGEHDIDSCIEMLLKQSYSEIEIVIVDDGSTDKSAEKLRKYADNSKIRVLFEKHGGASSARNAGLAIAKGKFVSFVDIDDSISQYYVEDLSSALISDPSVAVSVGRFQTVRVANEDLYTRVNRTYCVNPDAGLEHLLMQQEQSDVSVWAKMYRHNDFGQVQFKPGVIFEDLDLNVHFFQALQRQSKIAFLDSILFEYVQRPGSTMHRKFSHQDMSVLSVVDRCLEATKDSETRLKQALANKLVSAVAGCYARSVMDEARSADQDSLYRALRMLCRSLTVSSPISAKSLAIKIIVMFGRNVSHFSLPLVYRTIKKI